MASRVDKQNLFKSWIEPAIIFNNKYLYYGSIFIINIIIIIIIMIIITIIIIVVVITIIIIVITFTEIPRLFYYALATKGWKVWGKSNSIWNQIKRCEIVTE